MKKFKMFLEAVQTMNSDKETRLKDYQDKVAKYNSDKGKFASIMSSKKQDQWETEAQKIIDGNVYLSAKWKLDKMQHSIKQDTDKLASSEVTADEKKQIQQDVNKNNQELSKSQHDLNNRISQDLRDLQKL
jgi:hypothetical protein